MIEFGFGARQFGSYQIPFLEEVETAKRNGFDFLQIWYDAEQGLEMIPSQHKKETIKNSGFPTIIHAVLDVSEIEEQAEKLIPILKYLGHKELIIHPESKETDENVTTKLIEVLKYSIDIFSKEGISLYLENNSKLDQMFSRAEDIKLVFSEVPKLEFLLDIAHIDDLDHLSQMVAIKYPKILHIADRHLEVLHEHLPVGQGNIDFKYISENILKDYSGKIIFEVTESTESLIESKNRIIEILV